MTEFEDPGLSSEIKFHLVRRIEYHKVIGVTGLELLPHESKYIEFHRLTGIILFDRNIESLAQVRELVENVDELLTVDDRLPLIMADHEGDFVSELRRLIGVPPSAMAVAATKDPALAYEVAFETGRAMKKLGVNVVLAPVADCYTEPESPVTGLRTFGQEPEQVAEFVVETIRGYREAGVISCVKHFPGHGATGGDSHVQLPVIDKSLEDLRGAELIPFTRAVAGGVDMVMTAHVVYSLGDPAGLTPASFDPRLLRGVLRDEMGFEGVIISDALEMEGARRHARERYGGLTGGFERALLAGSDILLYASPLPERILTDDGSEPMIAVEMIQTIIDTLSRVVDRSRVDRKLEEAAETHEGVRNLLDILNRSERRILELRDKASGLKEAPAAGDGNVISLSDYATVPPIYKTVAERSLVLLRDPQSFIPAGADDAWLIVPVEYGAGGPLKRQELVPLIKGLRQSFPHWKSTGPVVRFEVDPTGRLEPIFGTTSADLREPEVPIGRGKPRVPESAPVLPVLSFRGKPPDDFLAQTVEFIEQRYTPFVLVTGWPLVEWVPEGVGCLLTLGASASVAAAVVAVLSGDAKAPGSLQGLV